MFGPKYERAYLALILTSAQMPNKQHPWSVQGGFRVTDWLTLVGDNYPVVFRSYEGAIERSFQRSAYAYPRAYRFMPTFTVPHDVGFFSPYLFYIPEHDDVGWGVSIGFGGVVE